MAKQEYEGVAFTSGIKDGWQVSVTERSNSSADAVARLEATIALMEKEGYVPFVSYYNRAEGVQPDPVSTIPESAASPAVATTPPALPPQPEGFPDRLPVDATPGLSVVGQAQVLGGVPAQAGLGPVTPQEKASISRGVDSGDGYLFLGIKTKKPKVAECVLNESYEIMVDRFERDEKSIKFFNVHATYPACTHFMGGKGGEIFEEIFPDWNPQPGEFGPITPIFLYIVGEGQTDKGNAWQNLKSARAA